MIGDESSRVLPPSSPTSTGHVLRFSHSSASSRNSCGGSVMETNSPPATSSVVWVEQKVCRSVLSLSSFSQGVVLVILTVSLKIPSRKASASTSTSPHSARQLRTRAPSTSLVGPVISSWLLPPEISIPARSGLSSSSDSVHRPTVISRSVASSHGRECSPPICNSSTNSTISPLLLPTLRSVTCRKRTLTSTFVSPSPNTRHWVCISQGSSSAPASLYARG